MEHQPPHDAVGQSVTGFLDHRPRPIHREYQLRASRFQDSFTANSSTHAVGDQRGAERKFLGVEGIVEPGNKRRVDSYVSTSIGFFYTLNQHLKFNFNYTYYRSFSTLDFAEFARDGARASAPRSHW